MFCFFSSQMSRKVLKHFGHYPVLGALEHSETFAHCCLISVRKCWCRVSIQEIHQLCYHLTVEVCQVLCQLGIALDQIRQSSANNPVVTAIVLHLCRTDQSPLQSLNSLLDNLLAFIHQLFLTFLQIKYSFRKWLFQNQRTTLTLLGFRTIFFFPQIAISFASLSFDEMVGVILSSFEERMLELMYVVMMRFAFCEWVEAKLPEKWAVIAMSEVPR